MYSPVWVRENRGNPDGEPGLPYQDPKGFNKWLAETIGTPAEILSTPAKTIGRPVEITGTHLETVVTHSQTPDVIIFGLTVDCCVFCTAQELAFRGYNVKILDEGTDTRSGSVDERKHILTSPPLKYWASSISWQDFQKIWD